MPIPPQESGTYQAQVIMRPDTLPDSNTFQNVLYFQDILTPERSFEDAADDIKTVLDTAYNATHSPGTAALAARFSKIIDPALTSYKIYDLSAAAPRIPITLPASTWTLGGDALPNEVAAVLSFRSGASGASGGSSDPTRRGRLYFGPLASATIESNAGDQDARFSSDIMSRMRGFGLYLLTQPEDMGWVQYSVKEDRMAAVTGGFVENAPDTQRRRGADASLRQIWPVV